MKDEAKTKDQLISELNDVRKRVAALEKERVEGKRAEEALRASEARVEHLNNVLKAMRDVSGLLNREKDPLKLLTAVCNSLAQTRGYVMAWVGQPEAGSKRVLPVTHSGEGSDFLQHSLITWDDSPSGQGPAGTAMRERRPVVFDDIANDPRFALWKESVTAYGGASIASVPIIHRERLFGVLTVKADQPFAFDAEEIDLLSGLTADIARILQGLEDEAAGKHAEEALRQSEARLRLFIEHAPAALAMFDREMRYMSFSRRWLSDYNLGDRDLVGLSHYDVFPEIPERWKAVHRKALAGEVLRADNDRFDRADGSVQWERWEVRPWHDGSGNIAGTVIFTEDITERKRVEEELRESEERYRALVETSSDWVWEVDKDVKYTYADPKVQKILGYTSEEVVGRTPFDLMPAEEAERVQEVFAKIAADRRPFSGLINVNLHKGGREVILETNGVPILGPNGEFSGYRGMGRDVTERILAEAKISESEERFRKVIEDSPLGIGVSRSGSILYVNSKYLEMFGYQNVEELHGQSIVTQWAPEVQEKIAERLRKRSLGLDVPAAFEGIAMRKDGSRFNADVYISQVQFDDGLVNLAFISDITQRKQVEEELRNHREHLEKTIKERTEELQRSRDELEVRVHERTAELEKANEELRQTPSKLIAVQEEERKRLASELHDSIGQTLAAVKFWVEMALKLKDAGDASAALNQLEQFVPILQRSIEETRNIYMGLRPSMLDSQGLLATLEWLRQECMKLYPERHIELEAGIAEEAIPKNLKVNIFRIAQEALNNIAKHSKAEWVDISLSKNVGRIELVVSDDGVGMDLDIIMKTSTATSLGLTSMRERAELTGGSFSIESIPGEGTTVRSSWLIEAEDQLQEGGITQSPSASNL